MSDPTKADRYRAMELVGVLTDDVERLSVHVVSGDPISKARPRFTAKGRPYTPRKTIEGEAVLAWSFKSAMRFDANVAVACIFYRANRQRIDVDNLLKAVLDAATKAGVWQDDSQVTALVGLVEHDRANPRTIVCFANHVSSLLRGTAALATCQACGKRFAAGGQRLDKARWCSRACAMALAELVACPSCATPFRRRNGAQKFCSVACRGAAQKVRAKQRTHCARGHEMTPENTYVVADGRRRCRMCGAEAARRARTRAA